MNSVLPPVIAAFFHAHNTGQTADFNQLFRADARVSDEAHEYQGAAIKAWIDEAIAKHKPVADVIRFADIAGEIIATAQARGNSPGSPAQIRYKFIRKDKKIAALGIGN